MFSGFSRFLWVLLSFFRYWIYIYIYTPFPIWGLAWVPDYFLQKMVLGPQNQQGSSKAKKTPSQHVPAHQQKPLKKSGTHINFQ